MIGIAGSTLARSRWPHELFIILEVLGPSHGTYKHKAKEVVDLMEWCRANLDASQDAWRLCWVDHSYNPRENHQLLLCTCLRHDHVLAQMTWGGF